MQSESTETLGRASHYDGHFGHLASQFTLYDADAILSGETEAGTDRRFEEYFGLPSQREPSGHVPGPALLATRINSQAST